MKHSILSILLSMPVLSYACTGYIVGFMGKDNIFNQKAFTEYVSLHPGYCGIAYSWYHIKDATKFINTVSVPYKLYGFSQGANTVSELLKTGNIKHPEYIITIGAYRTTDVDFSKYNIKYDNYFDFSGKGQKSPGVYLNVTHDKIQQAVIDLLKN